MQSCDPQNLHSIEKEQSLTIVDTTSEKQNMQHRINHILYLDLGISYQLLRNSSCLEIQTNKPQDFLPPYVTFPPHRWEITTSLQADVIKCCRQMLTSAKAPSTQNLGHEAKHHKRFQGHLQAMSYIHPFCLEQSQRRRQGGRCHIANIQHLPILAGLFLRHVFYLFLVGGYSCLAGDAKLNCLAHLAHPLAVSRKARGCRFHHRGYFCEQQQRPGKLDKWQGTAMLFCVPESVSFWGVIS